MASAGGGAGSGISAAGTEAAGGVGATGSGGPALGPGLGHGSDPLGDEAHHLVGEVYGWLSWANKGTTRGLRNRPFDAVLLRRDRGNREVPPGGWAAPEEHERVLRSVIWAVWPDRGPTWPAFLEGGAVLPITDADVNNWLSRALRSALAHWCYRRRNPPPPQPKQAAAQVTAQTADARMWGGELGPPTHAPPTVRRDERARATSRGREGGDNEHAGEPTAPQPTNR